MNESAATPRMINPARVNLAGLVLIAGLFTVYLYIYQFIPLAEPWNDVALNAMFPIAALLAAAVATAIYFHYHPADPPRRVWQHLTIGSWCWFMGDTLWGILAYLSPTGEVPTPSIADAFWIIGIAFFTYAFYHQYAIIFPDRKRLIVQLIIAAWLFAVSVPAIGLLLAGKFEWGAYVDYFYPASEIIIGIAGVALVVVFQGGALVRAWIGMVVFSVSDFFYAWAEQGGLYEWSSENNSLLTLAIDSSYLAAYLILAFGFLGHWLLINYGLRAKR